MNINPETTKHIENNISGKLLDMSLSNLFVDLTPTVRETNGIASNWNVSVEQRKQFTKWKGDAKRDLQTMHK